MQKNRLSMPAGYRQLSTLSRGQQGLLQQLLGSLGGQSTNIQQSPLFQQGSSYLQALLSGSPEATAAFEAPAMRQFQEQIIPALAERFAGLGAGAQSSSAFKLALGAAGAGLAENLAGLRGQLQLSALPQALGFAQQPISNLQGFSQLGLGTSTKAFAPRQLPFWQQLLLGLGGGLGQAGGAIGSAYGLKALGL
jgi:hypothetical protein